MEIEIKLHNEEKYVEIVTNGIADQDSSFRMAETIAKTMKQNRFTKALIDHRNISVISGKVVDIYERPKQFRLLGWLLGIRIAEVIKPEDKEHFEFFETVCRNNGYKFSVFYDRTEALEWLLK